MAMRCSSSHDRLAERLSSGYGEHVSDITIGSMLDGLDVRPLRGAADVLARRVVEDSRRVQPGDVFLARPGDQRDGRTFIPAAERAGAVAILSDQSGCEVATGPALCSASLGHVGAVLAHRFCGDPSHFIPVVGVTGTNGKTTVTTLLQQLLAGVRPCGLMGGVTIDDGAIQRDATLTTPMADEVASWLASSRGTGCGHAVMEVSSHALSQSRVDGIRFAAAVCTNLSGDHLDYHGTMEAYAASKRALFERLDADAICVINADDPAVRDMAVGCEGRVIMCSLEGTGDVLGSVSSVDCSGVDMQVKACTGTVNVRVPLPGRHNAMNALQALAVAEALGEDLSQVAGRLGQARGPVGRLELVSQSPSVLVDFAHTDGALEAVLRSLDEVKAGRIIVVVGCGGDRDRTKRPRMARVASNFADLVWFTSDNPRTEDPLAILDDMVGGVASEHLPRLHVQPDRSLAIEEAIAEAKPDDIVLIAGKGHERYQLIEGHSIPFDDRAVAMRAIESASRSS